MKKMKKRTKWRKFQLNSQDDSNSVPSVKSMKRASARLRRLRWRIYHEGKKSKVQYLLDEYKDLVGEFLDKFKTRLKQHEVGIWKKKLNQTVKDAFSPRKTQAKANNIWHVNAINVTNSESLKENCKSTPEIEMKLDEILLKLAKLQSLLEVKIVPSNIVKNTNSIRALDVECTLENVEKAVDDALDEMIDKNATATKHVNDAIAEGVLDVDPKAKSTRKRKESTPVISEVTPEGNTTFDEEVCDDDADDAVDQNNPHLVGWDESQANDAYASIYSIMKKNPMWNFHSKSVSEKAQCVANTARKMSELLQSHPDEITPRREMNVSSYLMAAVVDLETADVRTADEKRLVEDAISGFRDYLRDFL